MHFKSRKDPLYTSIFGTIIAFLIFTSVYSISEGNNFWATAISILINVAASILLLWILLGTSYALTQEYLHYKSGPVKGKISVETIRSIEVGKSMYIGLKPATASKGIIIRYNTYDEIYISPDDNESFTKAIASINPNIEIIH